MTDRDGDGDHNDDDYDVTGYGHDAHAAERRAITMLIERYHSATAAHDGTKACELLNATLAAALAAGTGRQVMGTCGSAVVSLLEQEGGRSDTNLPTIDVTVVRLEGDKALSLVRLPTGEEREITLIREGDTWKIGTLFDEGMI
jgi:hypothetical protein